MMKVLKIYKEDNDFIIERINEFNHATKRYYKTEEGLKEGIDSYIPVLEEYEIKATDSVWPLVINHLNNL